MLFNRTKMKHHLSFLETSTFPSLTALNKKMPDVSKIEIMVEMIAINGLWSFLYIICLYSLFRSYLPPIFIWWQYIATCAALPSSLTSPHCVESYNIRRSDYWALDRKYICIKFKKDLSPTRGIEPGSPGWKSCHDH